MPSKDNMIKRINKGLELTGVTFKTKVTKRLSIAQLQARLDWLAERYRLQVKQQAVKSQWHTKRTPAKQPWKCTDPVLLAAKAQAVNTGATVKVTR